MTLIKRSILVRGGLILTGLIAILLVVTLQPGLKPASAQSTQVVTVISSDMMFDVDTITVKAGQPVTLRLENRDFMDHGIAIDALKVRSEQIGPGQVTEVTFTPREAGSYEFYCFVNEHAMLGMVGTLQVIP